MVKGKENMVCKFQKSLYGLKQSPCKWNHKIIAYGSKHGWCTKKDVHFFNI